MVSTISKAVKMQPVLLLCLLLRAVIGDVTSSGSNAMTSHIANTTQQAIAVTNHTTTTASTAAITSTTNNSITSTNSSLATSKAHITKSGKPAGDHPKVPNPEVGKYMVAIYIVVITLMVFVLAGCVYMVYRKRRHYQHPGRSSSLRTAPADNAQFDNPIQFPTAAYGTSII